MARLTAAPIASVTDTAAGRRQDMQFGVNSISGLLFVDLCCNVSAHTCIHVYLHARSLKLSTCCFCARDRVMCVCFSPVYSLIRSVKARATLARPHTHAVYYPEPRRMSNKNTLTVYGISKNIHARVCEHGKYAHTKKYTYGEQTRAHTSTRARKSACMPFA